MKQTIYQKISKTKSTLSFIDNISGADLADMQLISKFSKGFRFLLSVIEIYSKYAKKLGSVNFRIYQ